MEGVAGWDARERGELFGETAARLGFGSLVVVEKDFWVCWVLLQLSALTGLPRIVFKGGTSLSKVFGLIRRFSEDIDLAFHRHDLGFDGERDPANPEQLLPAYNSGNGVHLNDTGYEAMADAINLSLFF